MLGPLLNTLGASDLLLITADHGCDPDPAWPTTDHSREYVPILAYAGRSDAARALPCSSLGVRATLADMGQTVCENFGATIPHGTSFLAQL
jgi:phosphopentomutase